MLILESFNIICLSTATLAQPSTSPMEDRQCSGNLLETVIFQFADARGAKTTHFTIKAQSRVPRNISVISTKQLGNFYMISPAIYLCSADMTVFI